ncbi:MAG: hypothetical protein ACRC8Y_11410 [Chroococcales cyanobacterium]
MFVATTKVVTTNNQKPLKSFSRKTVCSNDFSRYRVTKAEAKSRTHLCRLHGWCVSWPRP